MEQLVIELDKMSYDQVIHIISVFAIKGDSEMTELVTDYLVKREIDRLERFIS